MTMAVTVETQHLSPFAASSETTVSITTGHVGSKSKCVGWYSKTQPDLQSAARELLERYSGIPTDMVAEHVLAIISRASSQHPTSTANCHANYSAIKPGKSTPTHALANFGFSI